MDQEKQKNMLQNIPYIQFNGIVIDRIGMEESVLYVDMRHELENPYGMAHGGVHAGGHGRRRDCAGGWKKIRDNGCLHSLPSKCPEGADYSDEPHRKKGQNRYGRGCQCDG